MTNKKANLEEHPPPPPLDIPPELVSALAPIVQAFFEFLMKRWGIRDPITVLTECIEQREWFKGIVLSTAFFEGMRRKVLLDHFKGRMCPERIEHLRSLEQIIMFLYASGIIDQSTYSKMIEVNKFRNNLVHLEPFTEPKLQPRAAEKTIEKAISCLCPLIEKWSEDKEKESELIEFPPKPKVRKKEKQTI